MTLRPPIELERLRFWQGQMLRSRDFRDELAMDAERRWWHNRALHGAVGIVEGLDVPPPTAPATAVVTAGLAYDCYGRELLLPCDTTLPIPPEPRAEPLTLVIGLAPAAPHASCTDEDNAGACLPAKRCFTNPDLIVRWIPTRRVGARDGLALAQLPVSGAIVTNRQMARPLARPRIATGRTLPGATAWEEWEPPTPRTLYGFQVWVDTSAAGFNDIPHYFASLQGPRAEVFGSPPTLRWFPFDHVAEPTPAGFFLRIPDPRLSNTQTSLEEFRAFGRCRKLHVCWLGIECRPSTEPACCRLCGQTGCCEGCHNGHA